MADWLMSLTREQEVRGSVPLPGIVAGAVNLARVDPSHVREIGETKTRRWFLYLSFFRLSLVTLCHADNSLRK